MVNEKKGITLVTLVITMVVMAIFVSSIVFVGVGAIEEAQFAEFNSRIAKVEEAVNLSVSANLLKYEENDLAFYQWVGVIEGYTESDAQNDITLQVAKEINGVSVYRVETDILNKLKITENQNNYYIDIDGTAYYDYYMYKAATYYN